MKAALKRMKRRNVIGPDDISVEVWRCLGMRTEDFLTR